MSWITSLWHIALKSAEFDCIYNPSFGICHFQCYMHYNPLLFWGMLYMRVISHHTWIVTTHPDSLVKVERWMVHSTFFLNLPTNITNQRFTISVNVRKEKKIHPYLKRLS